MVGLLVSVLDLVAIMSRILRWRAALSGTDPRPQDGPLPRVDWHWNATGTRIVWTLS